MKVRRITETQFKKLCKIKGLNGRGKSRIYRVCVLGESVAKVADTDAIGVKTVYQQINSAFVTTSPIKL